MFSQGENQDWVYELDNPKPNPFFSQAKDSYEEKKSSPKEATCYFCKKPPARPSTIAVAVASRVETTRWNALSSGLGGHRLVTSRVQSGKVRIPRCPKCKDKHDKE